MGSLGNDNFLKHHKSIRISHLSTHCGNGNLGLVDGREPNYAAAFLIIRRDMDLVKYGLRILFYNVVAFDELRIEEPQLSSESRVVSWVT